MKSVPIDNEKAKIDITKINAEIAQMMAETRYFQRQTWWHPAAVITGIVLTSVGFTLAMLKLLAVI